MNELITAFSNGLTAFTATNIDDIVILLLFFSQVNTTFQKKHIVAGQYLGFTALVLASLPGFLSGFLFPRPWVGLLGLVPIAIGISRLLNTETETDEGTAEGNDAEPAVDRALFRNCLTSQTYMVAAITFVNGGDNIGIYVPLFASSTGQSLIVILGVFFSLVGVWCYVACQLTRLPTIAQTLTRYSNVLVPFVLIGLGILILVDSHTLENRGLAAIALVICCLCFLNLSKANDLETQSSEAKSSEAKSSEAEISHAKITSLRASPIFRKSPKLVTEIKDR